MTTYYYRNPNMKILHLEPDCALMNKSLPLPLQTVMYEEFPEGQLICKQCLRLKDSPKKRKPKRKEIKANKKLEEFVIGELQSTECTSIRIENVRKDHKITIIIEGK